MKFGSEISSLILSYTKIETVLNLELRLIPSSVHFFSDVDRLPFPMPWWGFLWPGGYGLAKFVQENPHLFKNKRVVDFGSGCGLTGLMALNEAKCKHVQFVDIDHFAGYAVNLNAQLNNIPHTNFECIYKNMLGKHFDCDILMLGDMFYDEELALRILPWLQNLNCDVYIGDPGRHSFYSVESQLIKLREFELPSFLCEQNHGLVECGIFTLKKQTNK